MLVDVMVFHGVPSVEWMLMSVIIESQKKKSRVQFQKFRECLGGGSSPYGVAETKNPQQNQLL
jgi:hypothetical protein